MRTKPTANPTPPGPRRGPIGFDVNKPAHPPTERTVVTSDRVSIWGWPSRGGLIELDQATPVDFDYLGLDPMNLPLHRDQDQDAEDELCQRLLLLGAKWYDSRERYQFLAGVQDNMDPCILAIDDGRAPPSTRMERRWVRVGWPSEGTGFWVAEFDNGMYGPHETENDPMLPENAGQVVLARTMDERCEILKRLGGQFFASLEDYEGGAACLRAWEEKILGEVGPLVRTQYVK